MEKSKLLKLLDSAIASGQADVCLSSHLPDPPAGKTVVVGAGKAAAAMAAEFERRWSKPLSGVVVTRRGSALPGKTIRVIEAAHPVPDENGLAASQAILSQVSNLSADDLVVVLLSGGGSALMAAPASDVSLEEKQDLTVQLLHSGALIGEINCVRKHLSTIKGGRLAQAAYPARVVTLIISDVAGDDLSAIASGPTVPDPTTTADALGVLERYGIDPPQSIRRWLASPQAETPKPGDPIFERTDHRLIASTGMALEAAANAAEKLGWTPVILGDDLEADAATLADQHFRALASAAPGTVLLSGGEANVRVEGTGKGGPNTQFCLEMLNRLGSRPGVWLLSADTDGIDGNAEAAGAIVGPDSFAMAKLQGLDPAVFLKANDSAGFFDRLGSLIKTGPTQTNLNDFRAIYLS